MLRVSQIILILTFSFLANAGEVFVTVGKDVLSGPQQKGFMGMNLVASNEESAVVSLNEDSITNLSAHMHEEFNRCGGFFFHESKEEALSFMKSDLNAKSLEGFFFNDYSITEAERVEQMIQSVQETQIRDMIIKLSSYNNRYYKSETGVESQNWIKAQWEKMSAHRSDVSVELFQHSEWMQPSIIMTIQGSKYPDEVVIIGGHADSIAGYWGGSKVRAPGADDNASGISTISEIMRVAMNSNYQPERTVKFMAYAAEEVGLRGSKAIAMDFKSKHVNVVGVMQFDMTNYKGSKDQDILLINDNTNRAQNEFLGQLMDTYLDISWGYTSCGYACSDHASWHSQGYPASFPFESTKGDMNHKIHTNKDLIDLSGSTANHAANFAKLGVAFLVEMAK